MNTLRFSPSMILVRPTSTDKIAVYHYGLWVEEDEVIHAMPGENVTSVSFEEFAAGMPVGRSTHTDRVRIPQDAITRARDVLGGAWWQWELLEHNCETFVLWCATGELRLGNQASAAVIMASALDRTELGPVDELTDKATFEIAEAAGKWAYERALKKD